MGLFGWLKHKKKRPQEEHTELLDLVLQYIDEHYEGYSYREAYPFDDAEDYAERKAGACPVAPTLPLEESDEIDRHFALSEEPYYLDSDLQQESFEEEDEDEFPRHIPFHGRGFPERSYALNEEKSIEETCEESTEEQCRRFIREFEKRHEKPKEADSQIDLCRVPRKAPSEDNSARYSLKGSSSQTVQKPREDDAYFEDIFKIFNKEERAASKGTEHLDRLKDLLEERGHVETFTEQMLRIIAEKGLKESDVYHRVFMDRKLFNKIRNDLNYQPSKRTALQLVIALRLTVPEAQAFLEKAGFALSHCSKTDLVVECCILQGIYDIFKINEMLDAVGMPTLTNCK